MKKISFLILAVAVAVGAQTKPRDPVAPSGSWADGLIRAYLFTAADSVMADSVQDWSSNNVWGVIVNTGSWTNSVSASHAPAWVNSGSNDYIECGSMATSGITDEISVFAVLNDANSGSGNESVAFVNRFASPEQTMRFRDDDASSPFDWQFGVYTSSMVEVTIDSIPNDSSSPYTGFFQIMGIYDGENIHGYRNGVLQGSSAQTGNILIASWSLNLGRSSNGGGLNSFWSLGHYAAFYMWSRVLTSEEISALRDDPYVMFRESEPSVSGGDLLLRRRALGR